MLAGVEDEVSAEHHTYTRPEDVEDFVKKTGVDSLAISIGTSHGAISSSPSSARAMRTACSCRPNLFRHPGGDREAHSLGSSIVLHGLVVPQESMHIINTHGGALKDAIGIPRSSCVPCRQERRLQDQHDSDSRLAMTRRASGADRQTRRVRSRKYLGPAHER